VNLKILKVFKLAVLLNSYRKKMFWRYTGTSSDTRMLNNEQTTVLKTTRLVLQAFNETGKIYNKGVIFFKAVSM
jgi:hypothetical protein